MGTKWTPEQREAARQRAKARMASGNAPSAATATIEPPDDATEELKRLAATLFGAASNKSARNQALGDLENFLARLNPRDYPDLAESEIVQQFIEQLGQRKAETNTDDPPGTIYNQGTMAATSKPWTEGDLQRSDIPVIEFEFDTFQDVFWNGLHRVYQPGVTYHDYRCFPDLVREGRRNMRLADEHIEYLMKNRNTLTDPAMAGIGTARVRGTADKGTFTAAGGLFTPDFAAAIAEAEGEGEAE